MQKNIPQENRFLHYAMTMFAWISFLLILLVVFMGEDIFPEIAAIYPDYSLPAFFIPWFLLVISSVQKLRESGAEMPLQGWALKTTIPIFIFVLPFFSKFLSPSTAVLTCTDECTISSNALLGFEPYCFFVAIIVLFLVHFLPIFNVKPKLPLKNKS